MTCDIIERILTIVPEDFYILCETNHSIFPVDLKQLTSSDSPFYQCHIETARYTNIGNEQVAFVNDYFTFNLTEDPSLYIVNNVGQALSAFTELKLKRFVYQLNTDELKWKTILRVSQFNKRNQYNSIELQKSDKPLNKKEFLNKYHQFNSEQKGMRTIDLLVHTEVTKYPISDIAIDVITTYMKGIGLNKKAIEINSKIIEPYRAVILYSELEKKNNPVCDFSLWKRRYKLPIKYSQSTYYIKYDKSRSIL
jgi:hypothetical protein